MNQISSSAFWVTRCNSLVRCIIVKCVRCKQLRGRLQQQKMADLPMERMNEEPPFTYCGVVFFGSFLVKDGRKVLCILFYQVEPYTLRLYTL